MGAAIKACFHVPSLEFTSLFMNRPFHILLILSFIFLFINCNKDDEGGQTPSTDIMQLTAARVGSTSLNTTSTVEGIAVDQPVVLSFSHSLDTSSVADAIYLEQIDGTIVPMTFSYLDGYKTVSAKPLESLNANQEYKLTIDNTIRAEAGYTFPGLSFFFRTINPPMFLESLSINGIDMLNGSRIKDIDYHFDIIARFSHEVSTEALEDHVKITAPQAILDFNIEAVAGEERTFKFSSTEAIEGLTKHTLTILGSLQSTEGNPFSTFSRRFYTKLDSSLQFPLISEEELMTLVQEQTFKYFWDFGHPVSGLSRERNTSGNTVTSGGSGFGIMAIIVGIERGFISREQGIERLNTIVNFLGNAQRFHGVWSHWLNGETGDVIPFSSNDNGGDLVETSFLAMGLLTARQYLDTNNPVEQELINDINSLWHSIEWDWHTQGGQNVLYWHWSPNFGWEKNHKIGGWNEALITYIIAAASPTHAIDAEVYHEGWARNGNMINGNEFYDITLPLGNSYGGPLFFEHYTFLGIDPRNLSDQYANYWEQAVNHSLINRAHCIINPNNYVGYGEGIWGLTASDNHEGYSAHSPTNDKGVITPTAALSSFPYTPDESMEAMKHFYYYLGDHLWGEYGFHDAFNPTEGWYANSFLAIDQGPIILMIENHRTGLLWDLFMSCPEIQDGLNKLGFIY